MCPRVTIEMLSFPRRSPRAPPRESAFICVTRRLYLSLNCVSPSSRHEMRLPALQNSRFAFLCRLFFALSSELIRIFQPFLPFPPLLPSTTASLSSHLV